MSEKKAPARAPGIYALAVALVVLALYGAQTNNAALAWVCGILAVICAALGLTAGYIRKRD